MIVFPHWTREDLVEANRAIVECLEAAGVALDEADSYDPRELACYVPLISWAEHRARCEETPWVVRAYATDAFDHQLTPLQAALVQNLAQAWGQDPVDASEDRDSAQTTALLERVARETSPEPFRDFEERVAQFLRGEGTADRASMERDLSRFKELLPHDICERVRERLCASREGSAVRPELARPHVER